MLRLNPPEHITHLLSFGKSTTIPSMYFECVTARASKTWGAGKHCTTLGTLRVLHVGICIPHHYNRLRLCFMSFGYGFAALRMSKRPRSCVFVAQEVLVCRTFRALSLVKVLQKGAFVGCVCPIVPWNDNNIRT